MLRKSSLFWFGSIALAGVLLFRTSYQVQEAREELSAVNHKIASAQEAIQVLKAEWGFFNEPARLEQLTEHYLHLRPTETVQLASLTSLTAVPMRPQVTPAVVRDQPQPTPPVRAPYAGASAPQLAAAPLAVVASAEAAQPAPAPVPHEPARTAVAAAPAGPTKRPPRKPVVHRPQAPARDEVAMLLARLGGN
ncbi:MAG: hypothetical protein GC191_00210 [Azospirillum sp.]|nr:hypothetical protein [Azospirillum sp.]